jgi:hypothetical protein
MKNEQKEIDKRKCLTRKGLRYTWNSICASMKNKMSECYLWNGNCNGSTLRLENVNDFRMQYGSL